MIIYTINYYTIIYNAVQAVVGSIVWAFRRVKKPRYREMSARGYALHSVYPQRSFLSIHLFANFYTIISQRVRLHNHLHEYLADYLHIHLPDHLKAKSYDHLHNNLQNQLHIHLHGHSPDYLYHLHNHFVIVDITSLIE